LTRDRTRLSAVLSGMVEGVLVVNASGDVELINRAAQQMLRLQASVVGRRYTALIRHPDIAAQISEALEGRQPAGIELTLTRDPEQILISRAAPVGPGGTEAGALLALHDITDLRRADRIRRDFVANVSHELRTPLTAIRGYVEALLDAPDDPDDRARFLAIIARHSSRMESLVKDLLRLARLDAGQEVLDQQPCATESLFNGVVTELRPTLSTRDQRVLIHIAPDAVTVTGDPAKLHDIIRNLTENASNYSPERSTITLDAWREDAWLILRVSDEGPGIPDADVERIFERFYRVDKARSRETGGTGLGLSIVKHLVDLHGGSVHVVNDDRGGAQFTVRLPVV
ncbi:MAG: PAS domain-containing protein, partial [Acidobacteria bacterium]|nr:PAS domain-containing protein [Acidobacteriota bacterium]